MPIVDIGGVGSDTGEIGAGASPPIPLEEFQKMSPATFSVAGLLFAFPVLQIQETGGNRIVERERPYRDGAKLDDTGSVARRWSMEAIFNNSILIPGVNAVNKNRPLYPDILNELLYIFDNIHETGDLFVPTAGAQRVRADQYSRTEVFSARNQAIVTFTWIEDNEDIVGTRLINPATAGANAQRLATTMSDDSQSVGSLSESLADLDQTMSDLEDIVNAPGEVAQDVDAQNQKIQGHAERSKKTFKEANRPGRNLFLDPVSSAAVRKIERIQDMAAREANESRRGRPKLLTVVFADSSTIFRVAAVVRQDPLDLMAINPQLDPFFIPKLTPVKIFSTESLLNAEAA